MHLLPFLLFSVHTITHSINVRRFILISIQYYSRKDGIKKQLYDTTLQVCMVNKILARQNNAINTFMTIQFSGISEDQILDLCKAIDTNGQNLSGGRTEKFIFITCNLIYSCT